MQHTEQFDDQLLAAFIEGFYGYGNYGGQFADGADRLRTYWFVGMEEGGGHSFRDIAQRLNDWNGRGRCELEDIAEYHAAIGAGHFFGERPKLQATWKKLIRVRLAAEGHDPHVEEVRRYQQTKLGRHGSDNCLVELMPLPSPSSGHWLYGQHSNLVDLATRTMYMRRYAELRARHLKQRIEQYQPRAVVFYSSDQAYMGWWKHIADVDFSVAATGRFYIGSNGPTVFAIMRHPVGFGTSNAYCQAVGHAIAAKATALRV